MSEMAVNELMASLMGLIPEHDIGIVKEQVLIWLTKYELTKKTTALQVKNDGLLKELQAYVVAKTVEGMSQKSLKLYYKSVSNLIFFTNKPATEITTGDILAYLHTYQRQNKVKDITLDNTRLHISAFYTWLVNSDYTDKNPCKQIKAIKHEKNTRHPLTALQMEKLRSSCENLRDKAIIEVLYATACRVGELVNLKRWDIDIEHKEVHLFGKGKKHRTSYLNARAVVALQNYLDQRTDNSDYLFVSLRKPHEQLTERAIELLLNKYGKKANINAKCTPHIIRHSTATDALNKGMPIEQLQKLLGHENIETTLIYAEVSNDSIKNGHQKYII